MAKQNITERVADIDKRRAELEAERKRLLAQKSAADRKTDTRRKIILGGTVMADERLRHIVWPMLDGKLTAQRDRALFGLPDRSMPEAITESVEEKPARPTTFSEESGTT